MGKNLSLSDVDVDGCGFRVCVWHVCVPVCVCAACVRPMCSNSFRFVAGIRL